MLQASHPGRHIVLRCTLMLLGLMMGLTVAGWALASGGTPRAARAAERANPPLALRPSPADLALGDRLYHYGQYDEAVVAYRAVMAQGQGSERRQAHYRLARTYLAAHRYDDAARALRSYIAAYPPNNETLRARFLLTLAYLNLGRLEDAELAFAPYAAADAPAAPYGHLALARALADAGQPQQAAAHLERALSASLPPKVADDARQSLAQAYAASQQPTLALSEYENLRDESTSAFRQAQALWGIAAVSEQLEDQERRREAFFTLINGYPRYAVAEAALAELLAQGEAVDPFRQGLVYFHRRRNQEAIAALEQYLATEPSPAGAAAAHYYLAILAERLHDNDAALRHYEASQALDPQGPLADDAMWWRAQLLEHSSQMDAAIDAYSWFWRLFPTSPWAEDAAFRTGLLLYRQGRYDMAWLTWSISLPALTTSQGIARAYLWLGKVAQARGEDGLARAYWARAVATAPTGYYGLRAELLRAGRPQDPYVATTEGQPPTGMGLAWSELEVWLYSTVGPPDAAAAALSRSRPWLAGLELYELGLLPEATQEFRRLLTQARDDAWALYRLTRRWSDMGLTHLAAAAAERLLGMVKGAPRALLAQSYPWAYNPLVMAAAARNRLSPLLILSLIRQESFFDPTAASPAGALGLTQVMPSTAREIAQRLERADSSSDDLLRPVVSIEFGAYYLGQQMSLFDDNVYHALAAYNGGPGNALRWSQRGQWADPDLFLEGIDFAETRTYLRAVLENYANYRFLYAGVNHPTLLAIP